MSMTNSQKDSCLGDRVARISKYMVPHLLDLSSIPNENSTTLKIVNHVKEIHSSIYEWSLLKITSDLYAL